MLSGELPVGSQVPTEHALCDSFDVSRITARKALKLLHEEGVIERVRGRGSFVLRLPKNRPGSPVIPMSNEIGWVSIAEMPLHARTPGDWGTSIMRVVEAALRNKGYQLHPLPITLPRKSTLQELMSRIDSHKVRFAGMVLFGSMELSWVDVGRELDKRGIPWVTISQNNRYQTCNFVSADNYGGAQRLGRIFADNGYARSMVFGMKPQNSHSTSDKLMGFLHGYIDRDHSLAEVEFLSTLDTEPSPAEIRALRMRLSAADRPRAIFCQGDLLAIRILRVASELGLKVPDDLAVVGSTGLSIAEHMSPSLTVLAQPMQEIGEQTADFLIRMIQEGQSRIPGIYIPCPIIPRESCPVPTEAASR